MQADLFDHRSEGQGALFDESRRYRYVLWRRWAPGPTVVWIMLNPSTADEFELDPTLRRCKDYSSRWGYGAMVIVNVYALRSTDPAVLRTVEDPVGAQNLEHIAEQCRKADLVVLGWGTKVLRRSDTDAVVEVLRRLDIEPRCLRITKEGEPQHPLYLPKRLTPILWPTK